MKQQNSKRKFNNSNRRGKPTSKKERNNYQDKAMEREYNKGRDSISPIDTHSVDNDPSWYVARQIMAKNVASFPFGISTGQPVQVRDGSPAIPSTSPQVQVMPGVFAFALAPSCGKCDEPTDPINVAMSALYTGMQINSSRNPVYQANDLTLYIMAMGSAYSFYMWMTRLYGTLNQASILNRYTPKALVQAMGGNYDDLRQHMADFRAYINNYAYIIGSFYVPSDIDYFKRAIFIYENVYMDSNNQKAQYYLYKPAYFLKLIEGANDTTTLVQATIENVDDLGQTLTPIIENATFQNIVELGESILNPLRESEDIRIMAADMLKAFGAASGFSVNPIADTYSVTPVYVPEVLSQMENAYIPWFPTTVKYLLAAKPGINESNELNQVIAGEISSAAWAEYSFIDQENGNAIQWTEHIKNMLQNKVLINMHKSDPTPEDMLVASRLAHNPISPNSLYESTNAGIVSLSYANDTGTDFCIGAKIYYYDVNNALISVPVFTERLILLQKGTVNNPGSNASALTMANLMPFIQEMFLRDMLISAFDWYPKYHTISTMGSFASGSTFTVDFGSYHFDIDNWTTITEEEWERMNYQAMLGLFETSLGDVPSLK